MEQLSAKLLLLMRKLQRALRQQGVSGLSLQEDDILMKLLKAARDVEDEGIQTLCFQVEQELHSDIEYDRPLPAPTTPDDQEQEKGSNEHSLEAQLIDALTDCCGPISSVLFTQAMSRLGYSNVGEGYERLIQELASDIDDVHERLDFVAKCRQLV